MKRIILLLVCTICLFLTSVCFSEYYHYVDDEGVKHFTENYSDVPEKFKPQIRVQKSIKTPVKKEEQVKTDEDTLSITRKALIIEKEGLDAEKQALMEKREKLIQQKGSMDLKEYNELVKQLNNESQAYEIKIIDYEIRVANYNNQGNKNVGE